MDKWHIGSTSDDTFGIAEVAEQMSALAIGLRSALVSLNRNSFGWELKENSRSVGRAVIQLHVDCEFFEQFFNSSDGYRAMFRRGRRVGSAANAVLIDVVVAALRRELPESVDTILVKKIGEALHLVGRRAVDRSMYIRSLDPSLAKVWYATAEISCVNIRQFSFGISDEMIDVGLEHPWKKIEQSPGDCILEIKGAFVSPSGLFQTKDPEKRAAGLSITGGA